MNRDKSKHLAGFSIINQPLESIYEHYNLLHTDEKAYADTLKFDRRKHSYLLGRTSAKLALQQLIKEQSADSIFIDYGVFQFPVVKYVQNLNLQASISHCDNIGLALIYPEEHPLGIDIEKVEPKIIETLDRQLTDKEKELLTKKNLFTDSGHTLLWTAKEALSKIFRTGLMMEFKTLEIDAITLQDGIYESTYTNCGQYKAFSCILDDYVCSIVLPKNTTVNFGFYWQSFKKVVESMTH